MLLDEGLDTGPVLSMRSTPIEDSDSGGSLTETLAELGANLLVETIPGWIDGRIQATPQDDTHATYAPRIDKESGRIDWSQPATEIWRQVRAFNPWPGAFTALGETTIKLLEAWPLTGYTAGLPGDVVALPWAAAEAAPADRPRPAFAVVTGDGFLLPLKLQRAGKRPVFAEEFLRGERALLGRRLG